MSDTISWINSTAPSTSPRTFNSEDAVCHICQQEYDTGDEPEIPLALSCGHVLGSVCLSRWLHVPDRRHGCPMCRKTLFRARDEYDSSDYDDDLEEGEIEEDEAMSLDQEEEEDLWANVVDNNNYILHPDEEEALWATISTTNNSNNNRRDALLAAINYRNNNNNNSSNRGDEHRSPEEEDDAHAVGATIGTDPTADRQAQQGLREITSSAELNNQPPTAAGPPAPVEEDELSTAVRGMFGPHPSTEAVISMHRGRASPLNPALVMASVLRDHQHAFDTGHRSHRAATAALYDTVGQSLIDLFGWLRTHGAYNINACAQLNYAWRANLLRTAAEFRHRDRTTLIYLIKAGVFVAPRMEGVDFALRLLIAAHISSERVPFGEAADPVGSPHMFRVLRAMPGLTGAYAQINAAELRNPGALDEYDFCRLWEADMGIAVAAPGGGEGRSFDSSTTATTTGDMASLSRAVNRTRDAATTLLGRSQTGRGSETGASNPIQGSTTTTMAEDDVDGLESIGQRMDIESIRQRVDRTIAATDELLRMFGYR